MTCKFCNQNKKLIKAHIIPKCFHQNGPSSVLISSERGEYPRKRPIGSYDPKIICFDCEKLWNDYDTYACEILINQFDQEFRKSNTGEWFEKSEYDYPKLKLFFMSLLWRASVSSLEFFEEVSVGEKFNEKLKQNIRNRDPGTPHDFSVVLFRLERFVGETSVVLNPKRGRDVNGLNYYRIFLGNFFVDVKVDRRKIPEESVDFPFVLKSDYPLCILVSNSGDEQVRSDLRQMDGQNPLNRKHFEKRKRKKLE